MTLRYLLHRLGQIALVLCVVSVMVFTLTQILPGNAAVMILGDFATPEQVAALELKLGLHDPAYVQYFRWASGIVTGSWGESTSLYRPVRDLVLDAFSRSAVLAFSSLLLVTLLAVPLGLFAALWRGTVFDLAVSLAAYAGAALPEFVTATLLLVVFAGPERGLFPAGGYVPFAENPAGFLARLVLPTVALSLVLMAHIVRHVRAQASEVLDSDYVRAARLKGLSEGRVVCRHVLRNALAPAVAVISLDIGYLIGGVLVVEEIFAWPGVGRMMIYAIQNRDLPLLQAGVLLLATVYALSNVAADMVIAALDPRVRYE